MTVYVDTLRSYLHRANKGGMLRMLAGGTSVAFAVFAIGDIVNFVLQVVLARKMGKSDFGVYSYAMSWVFLLTVVSGIALDTATLRFVSAYRATKSWGFMRGFIQRSYEWTIACAIAVTLLSSLAVLIASDFSPGTQGKVFLIGIWMLPASAIVDLQLSLGRAYRRLLLAYVPKRLLRYAAILAGVWFAIVLGFRITSTIVMVISMLTLWVIAVTQFVLLRRRMFPEARSAVPEYDTRVWLLVALPLLGAALTQELMIRADVLVIGALRDSGDVAAYNVAMRISRLVAFALAAVNSMAAPLIAQYYARGNRDELQRLLSMIAMITFWPSLGIALGLAVFADPLLGLFGPGFDESKWPLLILIGGHIVNAGAGSVGYLLSMTGHERDALRVYATSAAFNVIAVFVGVHFGGIIGAAIATALTIAMWNIWLHALSVRYLQVYPSVIAIVWKRRGMSTPGSGDTL